MVILNTGANININISSATRALRWCVLEPKKFAVFACCIFGLALAWWLRTDGLLQPTSWLTYREKNPVFFAVAFVSVYALSVLATIPTLPLNLLAGALWGPFLGGIIATISTTLAAGIAFCSARYLLGQPLARRFDNLFVTWIQKEFDTKGWRFVAFLRLNPVFPTGPLNYVLGLTSIKAVTFIWSTFVFLLPPATAVAFIGSSMGSLLDESHLRGALRAAVLLAAAVTLLVGARYGAKYLGYKQTYDHDSSRAHTE